jgi:hypothetical protein
VRRAALATGLLLVCAAAAAAPPARAPEETPNDYLARLARAAPPGAYPRWLLGQQSYWTVVGVPVDEKEAALSEDGALEVEKEAFSIEPFLWLEEPGAEAEGAAAEGAAKPPAAGAGGAPGARGGRLVAWSDVRASQALEDGDLPLPSVTWEHGGLTLRILAYAAGPPGRSSLFASYRLENRGTEPRSGSLFLAVRPLQVLSAWQSLNLSPGFSPIYELGLAGAGLRVNVEKQVYALTPPDGFGACALRRCDLPALLAKGELPASRSARDPEGFASGAFRFGFELAAGASREVHLEVPFYRERAPLEAADFGPARAAAGLDEARRTWRALLARVPIDLPAAADAFERTARSSVGWILVHRDGPRIQPGSRCYERSWIRDGALTSAALLELGFDEEVAEFLRWYAPHQFADGKIPCCIDARGADPTPEHDSPGEFVYAVAEHYRMTRDPGLARALWPRVVAAIGYLERLRAERTTDAYRTPEKRIFFGLLPESISHEGYAKHAVHSFWDDLFALRGLRDAAFLARELGDDEHAAPWEALADTFQHDVGASMRATMERFGLAHLPASVELGDFDPTATAVWLSTGGDPAALPEDALRRTFSDYGEELDARLAGAAALERQDYAPYEYRIADAFVRLGDRRHAVALLDLAIADRRPAGWNQWPEILWRDERAPEFLGDLPHGWIASTYLHALRSLLVYERPADGALVVAAGVPRAWLLGGEPVRVRLPTWWGSLAFVLRDDGEGLVRIRLDGTAAPPGGFELAPPLPGPVREAFLDGKPVKPLPGGRVAVGALPAEVAIRYEPGAPPGE